MNCSEQPMVGAACGNSTLRQFLNSLVKKGRMMAGVFVEGALITQATIAQMATHPFAVANCIEHGYWRQKPEVLSAIKSSAGAAGDLDNVFSGGAGRWWNTEVYGILTELNATQTQGLPGFTLTATGVSVHNDAISNAVTVEPAFTDPSGAKKVRIWIFPGLAWNGGYTYDPFALHQVLAAGMPVATIALAFAAALPAGVTASHKLLTRGAPELDELIRSRVNRVAEQRHTQGYPQGAQLSHMHGGRAQQTHHARRPHKPHLRLVR